MKPEHAKALRNKDLQIAKLRNLIEKYKEEIIKLEIRIRELEKKLNERQ